MTGNGAGPDGTGTITDTGPAVNDPHFGEQGGLLTYGGYLRLPELLEQQVPVRVVADRLGHADPTMTMRVYQHVTAQAAELAVKALDHGLAHASAASPDDRRVTSDGTRVVDSAVDPGPGQRAK